MESLFCRRGLSIPLMQYTKSSAHPLHQNSLFGIYNTSSNSSVNRAIHFGQMPVNSGRNGRTPPPPPDRMPAPVHIINVPICSCLFTRSPIKFLNPCRINQLCEKALLGWSCSIYAAAPTCRSYKYSCPWQGLPRHTRVSPRIPLASP